jgi:hypothetical protein
MALSTLARLDAMLALTRTFLPAQVRSQGSFDDWSVVAPGLLWICADLVEAIYSSPPPRGRIRAEVLSRSLCEYVITFAWIAAAENEVARAGRLKQFEKDEFAERIKAENKIARQIAGQSLYAHVFDSERFPRTLLEERIHERAEALISDESIKRLPDTLQMATVADRRWMPEIELVHRNPFALFYFMMFTTSSFTSHPSVTSIAKVVTGNPPDLVVGIPESLGTSAGPYGHALAIFGSALLVLNRSWGFPAEEQILGALNTE